MYMKIIGSIFIIIPCALTGFYFAYKDIFRMNDLLEIKRALHILKSEIEFAKTPLPEAFMQISKRLDKSVGNIFKTIGERLIQREHESIKDIWSKAFLESDTYLIQEDIEHVLALGKTLGYLDKTMQISTIDMVVRNIDDKISILNEASTKNKKMYQSLGVLSGMLFCILLI